VLTDNSRESSPLQDIVLQSAPGSPGMSLEQRAADAGKYPMKFKQAVEPLLIYIYISVQK